MTRQYKWLCKFLLASGGRTTVGIKLLETILTKKLAYYDFFILKTLSQPYELYTFEYTITENYELKGYGSDLA
jgi:hypothetical protein